MMIHSIATQGRAHSSEYVMEYLISYGSNGLDYADYKEAGGYTKVSWVYSLKFKILGKIPF